MPEVPFTSGKSKLFASNLHVSLGPVPGVGTHRSPSSKLKNLNMENCVISFVMFLDSFSLIRKANYLNIISFICYSNYLSLFNNRLSQE